MKTEPLTVENVAKADSVPFDSQMTRLNYNPSKNLSIPLAKAEESKPSNTAAVEKTATGETEDEGEEDDEDASSASGSAAS